jgi:hypothetical protein
LTELEKKHFEFLNKFDWHYFTTLTTKYEMTLKTCRRNMEVLNSRLNNHGESYSFWVAEPFELKDGFHLHTLTYLDNPESFNIIKKEWQSVSGGSKLGIFNRLQLKKYDKNLGAGYYVGKYLLKKRSDYDYLFSGVGSQAKLFKI